MPEYTCTKLFCRRTWEKPVCTWAVRVVKLFCIDAQKKKFRSSFFLCSDFSSSSHRRQSKLLIISIQDMEKWIVHNSNATIHFPITPLCIFFLQCYSPLLETQTAPRANSPSPFKERSTTHAPLKAETMVTAGVQPLTTTTRTKALGSALKPVGGVFYCLLLQYKVK